MNFSLDFLWFSCLFCILSDSVVADRYPFGYNRREETKAEEKQDAAASEAKAKKEDEDNAPRFSIGLGTLSPSYHQKFGSDGKTKLDFNHKKDGFSYSLSNVVHPSSAPSAPASASTAEEAEKKAEKDTKSPPNTGHYPTHNVHGDPRNYYQPPSNQPIVNIFHRQGFPSPSLGSYIPSQGFGGLATANTGNYPTAGASPQHHQQQQQQQHAYHLNPFQLPVPYFQAMGAGLVANPYQGQGSYNHGNHAKSKEEEAKISQGEAKQSQTQAAAQPNHGPVANLGHAGNAFGAAMYGFPGGFSRQEYPGAQSYASPFYGQGYNHPLLQQSATYNPNAIAPYLGSAAPVYSNNGQPYGAASNVYGNGYGNGLYGHHPYGQPMTPEASNAYRSLLASGSDTDFFRSMPYYMF